MESSRTLKLAIRASPAARKVNGFLDLPRELRDLIYYFALVEPSLYYRRHKSSCPKSPRDITTFEQWPCFEHAIQLPLPRKCVCGKRTGVQLLAASRQVHREAAPIFWTQNDHCFKSLPEFNEEVGTTLRPEYRPYLRRISIIVCWTVDIDLDILGVVKDAVWSAFGRALADCTGLQYLELDAEFSRRSNKLLPLLKKKAPSTLEFNFVKPLQYDLSRDYALNHNTLHIRQLLYDEPRTHAVFILTRWPFEFTSMEQPEDMAAWLQQYRTNFLVHTRFAVETELFGKTWGVPLAQEPYVIAPGLDDTTSTRRLTLRDGSKLPIHILGLPISKATRLRYARERRRADEQFKATYGLTPSEQRLADAVQEIRETKKEREKNLADHAVDMRRKERDESQRRREQEDRAREQKAEQSQRRKVRRSERAVSEIRKLERKRVP